MSENEFEPRPGRIRAKGGAARARSYLQRVLAAAGRVGAPPARSRRFDGSRIGRGAATGRLLGVSAGRGRRAVVKVRLARLSGTLAAARAHLGYLQRDGASRDGGRGVLYGPAEDGLEPGPFLERCAEDRHQFRIILAPEDGDLYPDLKPLVRRFMRAVEEDLHTRLDWVAVDHRDTGHPHTHVVLRGKDDRGENLVIAREYLSHGLRQRLAGMITLDLGPRTELELEQSLRAEVTAERLTAIDRDLVAAADEDRLVDAAGPDPFRQALRAGRLRRLAGWGFAEDLGSGRWRIAPDLAERLRRLSERGDIIRTMQREVARAGLDRGGADLEAGQEERAIIGRVIGRGLSDELGDRHYMVIDGIDGRVHYREVGAGSAGEAIREGAMVRVEGRSAGPRAVDHMVAEIAARSGGRYDEERHRAADPNASDRFIAAHVRRLEAIRRLTGGVERDPDGSWIIGPDHLERASAHERRRTAGVAAVRLLSPVPIAALERHDGATWLDRELAAAEAEPLGERGLGAELRKRLEARRRWLVAAGFAEIRDGRTIFLPGAMATLERRDLLRAGGLLSRELGMDFVERRSGTIEGTLRCRVDLPSGSFALVERGREFSLVPWRPVLERRIGSRVAGMARGGDIDWSFGRRRGLGIS